MADKVITTFACHGQCKAGWVKEDDGGVTNCMLSVGHLGRHQASSGIHFGESSYSYTVDWQPIETMPDKGVFLVYLIKESFGSRIAVCRKHPNVSIVGGHFHFDMPAYTHWAPMPDPPADSAKEKS